MTQSTDSAKEDALSSGQGDISVIIDYRTTGSTEWKSVVLQHHIYFDLDEGEQVSWDSVPHHDHAIDYLQIQKARIRNTKLTIADAKTNVTKQVTETFWNGGKNRLIERVDTGPNVDYWEMIVEVLVTETPMLWEILRVDRSGGVLMPNYHGFIQRREDGSEIENRVQDSKHDL